MRKRTMEECYAIIPADHPRWMEDSQCFQDCDCWFCEITEGMVPVDNAHESSASSRISSTTTPIIVVAPTVSAEDHPPLLDSADQIVILHLINNSTINYISSSNSVCFGLPNLLLGERQWEWRTMIVPYDGDGDTNMSHAPLHPFPAGDGVSNSSAHCQDTWRKEVQRLLTEVPEVFSDDPQKEIDREKALVLVRKCIATRWNYILSLKDKVPKSHFDELVHQMLECIGNFVEIYGTEIAFCPVPPDSLLQADGPTDPPSKSKVPADCASSTTASSRRGPSVLPHVFKFLQLQGLTNDVWTCVQVPAEWGVDGYVNFWSVTEWFPFRTKFTQWYTKSFTAGYLPMASAFELSPGHVMRRSSYKGEETLKHALPIDAVSTLGIVCIMGSILPAKSLTTDSLTQCRSTLSAMEADVKFQPLVGEMPNGDLMVLQPRSSNKFVLSELKPMFKKLRIDFARFSKKVPGDSAEVSLGDILIALLRMRCDKGNEDPTSTFHKLLHRVIHSWSQQVERTLESLLLDNCPDPAVNARVHPFTKSARMRGNKSLQMSMVNRFAARGSGFISLKDSSLFDLGLVSRSSGLGTRTSNEYATRILVKTAEYMSTACEDSTVINFCFDAAFVSEEHVLSVVFRAFGRQFAGATQLLPTGLTEEQKQKALEAFNKAVKVMYSQSGKVPALPQGTFAWKEFRVPTKNLLMAISNCLIASMPDGFNLQKCVPSRPLVPRSSQADRIELDNLEKESMGLGPWAKDCKLHFVYNFASQTRYLDFMEDYSHYKLCFSADEGTEGFMVFQHLGVSQCYCTFWPDLLHKLVRRSCYSLQRSGGSAVVRKLAKLFRMSRGPWSQSKFGKMLSDARDMLLKGLQNDTIDSSVLEAFLPGVARDLDRPVDGFTVSDLILVLQKKSGSHHVKSETHKDVRWFSWFDHAVAWNKSWHVEAMVNTMQWFSEGISPWHNLPAPTGDSDSYSSRVFAWNVLADDTNQDYMRSLIAVFRPCRIYAAEYDRDVQRQDTACLKHALSLASGKRVEKLVRKTISDATSRQCLDYIGASATTPEAQELLQWHGELILYQIEALMGLESVHRAFPWRVVLILDPTYWTSVLESMKRWWNFTINVADVLHSTDALFYELTVTRHQNYRDTMTKAEYFDFDAKRMKTPSSLPFEMSVLAICGLQSPEKPNALMSSLPSELTFNSLRDAARRHAKQERASPASLHAVACKAASKHSFGCSSLELLDTDWSQYIGKSQIKTRIHQALRATDKELGIDSSGLTRNKTNRSYTKPHVWAYRLDLMDVLSKAFEDATGDNDAKRHEVLSIHSKMWVSKIFPELWFLREKSADQEDAPQTCRITTRAGPYTVGCVSVQKIIGASYALASDPYCYMLVTDFQKYEVAALKVGMNEATGSLTWTISGQWMDLTDYICDYGILTITAAALTSVCATLGLGGGRLDHVHRAELFLRHFQRGDDWIDQVLEELKARQRKRKQKQEKDEAEGGEQEPDPYEQLEGQSEDEALAEIQVELDEGNHEQVQEAAAAAAAGEQDAAMKPADGEAQKQQEAAENGEEKAHRSDSGGAHAPKTDRSLLTQNAELPPGVTFHSGHPKEASPFFQAFLPTGFVYEGKKSKSISYMGEKVFPKGTTRSMEQAKACVLSWSWQWWNSLTTENHSAIREAENSNGEPSKKRRRV
eukprot:s902_g23.t1